MSRSVYSSSLLALLVLALFGSSACTRSDPHLQFCRRASLCENLALLMDIDTCASQLPKALRGHDVDCRACLMSLSCEGLGTALNSAGDEHKDNLRAVCAACDTGRGGSARDLAVDDDDGSLSYRPLIPGLMVRGGQGAGQDTLAGLCTRIERECATSQLLISPTQCTEQLTELLERQPRPCVSCVTGLNCEGVGRLARDEARLERLCPYCGADLDQSCGPEGCEQDTQTYFLLPGIVPKTADQKPALSKLLTGEPLAAAAPSEASKASAAAPAAPSASPAAIAKPSAEAAEPAAAKPDAKRVTLKLGSGN